MNERLVYLARHGEHDLSKGPRRFIGQLDVPLSSEGIKQAERVAEALAGVELTAVYCSDLRRSLQTATVVSECLTKAAGQAAPRPQARPDLREISLGTWEGASIDDVRRQHPAEFKARGQDMASYRPPGGESFADCRQRAVRALGEIIAATSGNLLVVAHAGLNRTLLCHLLGMPLENLFRIEQDYGCLNVIVLDGDTRRVRLLNFIRGACP